ncbi:hypothetical protein FisN_2Hh230 [Fistulifera solaris]|uniref:Radical SAM core domain-containing protein n=1 Tax=Fistulifera solaris TaxID=1519565 RepID=A0A1Z5JEJ9_FISSO|nr:hypothetical protein FisN_2Hh230 [Fistulifera solaris]|eukprot:GAX12399.1 hypothetical protein FisN_2Hh230 [Fistulifera solaris]
MEPRRPKRTRKPPSPNSVLDRRAFVKALDDRGLVVKAVHIDAFYQALHRQHYPDLPEFVDRYYQHEEEASEKQKSSVPVAPLKNRISGKKNKNRVQLPQKFLEFVEDPNNGFVTVTSTVALQKTSGDQTTTKLAVRLHDGQLVESVLMRYVNQEGSRASLCVSSQCGCAMGCTFCATGTMGLSGNLTTGEILEQVVHADRILAKEWQERQKENVQSNSSKNELKLDLVRNIVFMGMGEPLDNYTNVVEACRALIDRKRWNLAHGRVTVSTVGLVKQIRRLTEELPEISLALSLHAPNQEMRSAIVPTAKNFYINDLIDALDGHMMAYLKKRLPAGTVFSAEQRIQESSRRRAMIEYVMLEGDTSSLECAHQLGKLCENRHLVVNLIPYNQTDVKDKLRCPSPEHIESFRRIVSSYGAFCTVRRTMGADIDSACGQLITLERGEKGKLRDIEDTVNQNTGNPKQAANRSNIRKSMIPQKTEPREKAFKTFDWDPWLGHLAAATGIAASCFFISTYLLLRNRNNK